MAVKMVFFDLEGTLFRRTRNGSKYPSAWAVIAKALGEKAVEEDMETVEKWFEGKYNSYAEWAEDSLKMHKRHGLTREIFEEALSDTQFHKGVEEVFAELRQGGIRSAIISGGFKAQADRAQKRLKIDHALAACEHLWNDDGSIAHWNILPCDFEGKKDFMHLIIKDHGLTPEECAFVGDGRNDVHLAEMVGISLAFNAHEDLKKAATHVIEQEEGKEDFRAILPCLFDNL